jgi:IPT/TIG domain./ASPIC and UnbV.
MHIKKGTRQGLFFFSIVALNTICALSANAQAQFTNVTVEAGVGGDVYESVSNHVTGTCWIDFNNDSYPDLLVTNGYEWDSHLYQNNKVGTFSKVDYLLPELPNVEMSGCVFGDYDNDGDSDIYIQVNNEQFSLFGFNSPDGPANILLKNLWVENGNQAISGEPLFQNVAAAANVDGELAVPMGSYSASRGMTGGWLDYNLDGCLDLYVGNWVLDSGGDASNIDSLFQNQCDGTFSDVTASSGVNTGDDPTTFRPTQAFIGAHLDDDYFPDMVAVATHDPAPFYHDIIFKNNGDGTFIDVTGLSPGVGDDAGSGMGIDVGDIDNNGTWDIYITDRFTSTNDTAPAGNVLYLGNGDGTFQDNTALAAGIDGEFSWGIDFVDIDQDGYEDFLMAAASGPMLYINNTDGTFTKVTLAGSGGSRPTGLATADYDRDGDIDFAVVSEGDGFSTGGLRLFRNDTANSGRWLQFKLVGAGAPQSNVDAIGAVIKVSAGSVNMMRQIVGGMSSHSQSSLDVHFGLGVANQADSVDIHWPSGVVTSLTNVEANKCYSVSEDGTVAADLGCLPNPTIQNISPNNAVVGQTLELTITGTGFQEGASVQVCKNPGVTVNSVTVLDENTILASVTVGPESHISCGITVTNTNGKTGAVPRGSFINLRDTTSVARQWNEVLLDAIRADFARPTVHARNLYHTAAAMYDAWAGYSRSADQVLHIDKRLGTARANVPAFRAEAISYAAYRVLSSRFASSPKAAESQLAFDNLMDLLGYDKNFTTEFIGGPASFGNTIAATVLAFGDSDTSNEAGGYANLFYQPVNDPLLPGRPGNPDMSDPNRWQPLVLNFFIDQSGNLVVGGFPEFLSPEWGTVTPFALQPEDLTIHTRDGNEYWVYHDPGAPPHLGGVGDEYYKWGVEMVSIWSSHLDPTDGVMIDISPASFGNSSLPAADNYESYYDHLTGGDWGVGYTANPVTGQPYTPQIVPRGDYTRVLAEFWADGPDSETPPGHWHTIFNYVSDHPLVDKRIGGRGQDVDDLEWDVKGYLVLAGAMHDSAISAWGMKGWYDYTRPVSALRYMADLGQSSDINESSYHPDGIRLYPGLIEVVTQSTTAEGQHHAHLAGEEGKIAVFAWRGPDYIGNPDTDEAGVGWILAENWWPYQRPSFVTPPFAGYVSGHSTFSRAAAEVMTSFTGSPWFPGGVGEFEAPKNEFLVFEEGPSVDITLQWASYRDASDQTSLSRIWGGIHPPADDLPGRIAGEQIGLDAYNQAQLYWRGSNQ